MSGVFQIKAVDKNEHIGISFSDSVSDEFKLHADLSDQNINMMKIWEEMKI